MQKPSDTVLQQQLAETLADIKSPEHVLAFLTLFLSDTELEACANRLAIFKRLHQKKSYATIQQELGVSSATISSVAQVKDNPLTEELLSVFETQAWAHRLAQKIRSILHVS